jgi:hypothetical protein
MMKDGAPEARVKIWGEAPPSFDIRYSLVFVHYSIFLFGCGLSALGNEWYYLSEQSRVNLSECCRIILLVIFSRILPGRFFFSLHLGYFDCS